MFLNIFTILIALTAICLSALHLHLDYLLFKALGPGGTPPTINGFVKVKLLSLAAVRNPFEIREIPDAHTPHYLTALPLRTTGRPITRGIAPHRQTTQQATEAMARVLFRAIAEMCLEMENVLCGVSRIEGHGIALFSNSVSRQNEACHLHWSDGSMHAVLAPADSEIVLEAGWGERHPLSRGGWFERFVPADFAMIYAPQDHDELAVVLEIVKAAA